VLGPNETLLTNCVSNNFFGVPSLQLLNTAIISLALHGYMGHFFFTVERNDALSARDESIHARHEYLHGLAISRYAPQVCDYDCFVFAENPRYRRVGMCSDPRAVTRA
jgi:hypothetical protein